MTPRFGAFLDSCRSMFAGNSRRWVVSSAIWLILLIVAWAIEQRLATALPWLLSGIAISLLGVVMFGYHALRLERDATVTKLTGERDQNSKALTTAITFLNEKDSKAAEARRDLEALRASIAQPSPIPPTLTYMGFRWKLNELGNKNVAHCLLCREDGRLIPLEEEFQSTTVELTCRHPVHGKDGMKWKRDKQEYVMFANVAYTTIPKDKCT